VPCALITGGSDVIAYGFAQELMRRGFGVVLLAFYHEKLLTARARLE